MNDHTRPEVLAKPFSSLLSLNKEPDADQGECRNFIQARVKARQTEIHGTNSTNKRMVKNRVKIRNTIYLKYNQIRNMVQKGQESDVQTWKTNNQIQDSTILKKKERKKG